MMINDKKIDKSLYLAIIFSIVVLSLYLPIISRLLMYVVILYGIHTIIRKNIVIPINIGMILLFILVFSYFWGLFLNQGILYNVNKNEIKNIVLIFFVLIFTGPISKLEFKKIINYTARIMSVATPLISMFSLYKLMLYNKGVYISFIYSSSGRYPSGTSLTTDYNMYALGLFIGLILIVRNYIITNSFYLELYYLFSINIISLTLLLTGSRRAYVVLLCMLIYFIIVFIRKLRLSRYKFRTMIVVILFIILTSTGFSQLVISEGTFTDEMERVFTRYDTISESDNAFASRSDRWQYASEILKDSSLTNLVFGQGFGYVKLFDYRFNVGHEDYPHNFLLSAILSTGIIGVIITLTVLLYTFYKLIIYSKNRQADKSAIIIYIILLVFLSISGNMLISITVLPIFILYILLLKEKEAVIKENEQIYESEGG